MFPHTEKNWGKVERADSELLDTEGSSGHWSENAMIFRRAKERGCTGVGGTVHGGHGAGVRGARAVLSPVRVGGLVERQQSPL